MVLGSHAKRNFFLHTNMVQAKNSLPKKVRKLQQMYLATKQRKRPKKAK
jgi:hypothetical protein